MNVTAEVKRLSKNKWVLLAAGILLGGTVLAGIVALVVGRTKALVGKVTGGATAEKVSALVNPTK